MEYEYRRKNTFKGLATVRDKLIVAGRKNIREYQRLSLFMHLQRVLYIPNTFYQSCTIFPYSSLSMLSHFYPSPFSPFIPSLHHYICSQRFLVPPIPLVLFIFPQHSMTLCCTVLPSFDHHYEKKIYIQSLKNTQRKKGKKKKKKTPLWSIKLPLPQVPKSVEISGNINPSWGRLGWLSIVLSSHPPHKPP